MPDVPQTQNPTPPRRLETQADAQTAITQLTAIMDELEAVVAQETELVRAGQLRNATSLGVRKGELSGSYFKAVERLKASNKFLLRTLPQEIGALTQRHEFLQAVLKSNLVVLATAHAVSEGIMRRLSGDLTRKATPHVYGASGRTTAPDPKRAQPLAFSRRL
jgi:hypothetical protein